MNRRVVEVIQVSAPHFVAGVVAIGGVVTSAAPILRWTKFKPVLRLERWCATKGYDYNVVIQE